MDLKNEKYLVDGSYLLEKFPGKGGWTYARIPEISQNPMNPFGWVKVKGEIDDYPLIHYKLMPMGEGKLFLPVKADIRKKIRKQAGDYVHIQLALDESILEIPDEINSCFETEEEIVKQTFTSLTEGQRKTYLDWIYNAKTDETKINRILAMMDELRKMTKV